MLSSIITNVENFLKRPFKQDMSAIQWGFFLGFVMLLAIIWSDVLRHYKIATRIEGAV